MIRVARLGAALVLLALAAPVAASAEDPPFVEWTALAPGLTTDYEPSTANDCAAGRTHCVDAAVREMKRRFDPLAAACDHNAIFSLTYLRTTEEYRRTIDDPTFFEDTAFVNHEDAVFARLYLSAYDAWHHLYAEIARRFDPTIDDSDVPGPVDDTGVFQLIPTWREIAWRNAERLVNAPTPEARAQV